MSKVCEHVKENGSRCKSLAMFRRDFCYFHWRIHMLQRDIDNSAEPPALDSEAGVQLAAAQIFRSLAAGTLEPYRAQTMLASLNVIAKSLRCNEDWPCNEHIVRELPPAMEKHAAAPEPSPETKGPASIEEIFSSDRRNPCR